MKCRPVNLAATAGDPPAETYPPEQAPPRSRRREDVPEPEDEEQDETREPEEEDIDRPRRRGRTAAARSAVSGPAIALMIAGGLGLVAAAIGVVFLLVVGRAFFHQAVAQQQQMQRFPGQRPGFPPQGPGFGAQPAPNPAEIDAAYSLYLGYAVVALVWGAFVLFGAIQMFRLRSYGLAMASSIIAMLPCNGCCLLGLPFGIWAVVMLAKPEVKDAFG
jgi:hypothetical protein